MSSLTRGYMSYHVTNRVGSTNRIVILVVLCSLRDVLTWDTSGTIKSCARNGCQNFVDEGDFQHNCRCDHLKYVGLQSCIDGCQSVKCKCYRRPGFNCTLWCKPSPPGCDCTGLWNTGKSTPERVTWLMSSSSIATTTTATTTEDDMYDRIVALPCYAAEKVPDVFSPFTIASMIGGLVGVAIVILMVVFCVLLCRCTPCWTRRPIGTPLAQNHAPPTYEDTIKLQTIVVPGNRQPAVPPPYSEHVPPYTPFQVRTPPAGYREIPGGPVEWWAGGPVGLWPAKRL